MNRVFFPACLLLFSLAFATDSIAQLQFENIRRIDAAGAHSIAVLPADYDGDGDMDLLGTTGAGSNISWLFRNDGDQFISLDIALTGFYYGGMYLWADIDNDNDLDIIGGGCTYYCYNWKGMYIYRNDGGDRFTLVTQPTNLIGGKSFSLADYDNDGLMDIEIATQSDFDDSVIGHTFYRNTGNFVFQQTFQLPVNNGEVVWADLDNDGWKDFVLMDHAYKNLKNGTFSAFDAPEGMQAHFRQFIFDADDDGDMDVITSNGIMMKNDGAGVLTFGPVIVPMQYIGRLLVADFDGDGNTDMVATGGNNSQAMTKYFRSNGDGTFQQEDVNEQYTQSYEMTMADMDHDNDPDLLVSGVFTETVAILENGATDLSKPGVPPNLQSSINSTAVTLSWDAATDNEQSSVAYNVYLKYGDWFQFPAGADLLSGSSFIAGTSNIPLGRQLQIPVSNLPDGYYQWSVQSVDAEMNTSSFAPSKEFTLYKDNPAYAPTGLHTTSVGFNSITVQWIDNATNETSYDIERSSVNGNSGFNQVGRVNANTVMFIDNSVSSNQVYYYRVKMNGPAVSYSNVISLETEPAILTPPGDLQVTSLGSASVVTTWQYPGGGIDGFRIERSTDDKAHFTEIGDTGSATLTFTDRQVDGGRTYYYRVVAVNTQGTSEYSNIVQATVPLKEFVKNSLPSLSYDATYLMLGNAWGDYDNDGFDDLFIPYKAQLFHNKGDGTFERVSNTGITVGDQGSVASWADYNNDNFLDLYTFDSFQKGALYRGHGDGTFTRITTVTGIESQTSDVRSVTWTDYDLDGDLDLSVTGGRYIYRYDGNDTFVKVDFPQTDGYYYSADVASWGDYNDDGDPDVYIGSTGFDEFFVNNGDGSLTPKTDLRITKDYNYSSTATATAIWNDFNNDGKLDLTTFHFDGPVYVYANHNNSFDSAFYSYNYGRESWKNIFWTDYDSDGDQDLFIMGQYDQQTLVYENREGEPFKLLKGGPLYSKVETDAPFSWNDYDNNGFPDLFPLDNNHSVYQNVPNGNNWIKIRLRGRASNSHGVGAKIFVKSNGKWQRSDVTTHHSYRTQQGFMTLFGLGRSQSVDSIRILWPSGNRQYLKNVSVNQVILIDENDAQEKTIQAPSNLIATVKFPSTITLTWTDRSDDETGFIIEAPGSGDVFTQIATVGPNVTTFESVGNTPGGVYRFRVRAAGSVNSRSTNIVAIQIRLFTNVLGGDLTRYQSRAPGFSWADPDEDGDQDLFVAGESWETDAIYVNDNGLFTRQALGNTFSNSKQGQWIDYNNDGHLDLHISATGNDFLFKNNGTGQLIPQTDTELSNDTNYDYTAAWGDLNKDSWLDMIAGRNDVNQVFLNLGGNLVRQMEGNEFFRPTDVIVLSDIDDDGDLDLFAGTDWSSFSVFKNTNGVFQPDPGAAIFYSARYFAVEDFDNDGDFDLLLAGSGTLRLLEYDLTAKTFKEKQNAFVDAATYANVSVGDLDNNGFIDIIASASSFGGSINSRIYLNEGDLKFTSLADPLLSHNILGTALADFNNDGHLDVVASTSDDYYANRYLLAGNETSNHWLRVKLVGSGLNKFAIGAKVKLFAGTKGQLREVRSGTGGTFTNEQIVHFGLGPDTSVDYVKVEWPTGEEQWIANPAIDTQIAIEQANVPGPSGPATPLNLSAGYVGEGLIGLEWDDKSDNESAFRIERTMNGGPWETLKILPGNSTTFTDSSMVNIFQPSLKVTYRVFARRYDLDSDPSNEASITFETDIHDREDPVMYPHPATTKVFIKSKQVIRSVLLNGMKGETIFETTHLGVNQFEIPLTNVVPGMYIIQITTDLGTSIRKLIVVPEN